MKELELLLPIVVKGGNDLKQSEGAGSGQFVGDLPNLGRLVHLQESTKNPRVLPQKKCIQEFKAIPKS